MPYLKYSLSLDDLKFCSKLRNVGFIKKVIASHLLGQKIVNPALFSFKKVVACCIFHWPCNKLNVAQSLKMLA